MGLKQFRAIGLMSGTSADGVDVALIETDGASISSLGPYFFLDYRQAERTHILDQMRLAIEAPDHGSRLRLGQEIASLIAERHVEAVQSFLDHSGFSASDIDVIGFHGQTLFHDPATQFTLQAGDARLLANEVQIPVVYDLRSHDLSLGGQGAPLVPVYHQALVSKAGLDLPVAVVNIGGIANVTYVGAEDGLIAFDTGPGNVLVDEFVAQQTGERMDVDGKIAALGQVDQARVDEFLDHAYFKDTPPKSLDRYEFSDKFVHDLGFEDAAATLVDCTVRSILASVAFLPARPQQWIVVGGGAKNPYLMQRFEHLAEAVVVTGDSLGWYGGYVEAEAFGFLAVRHLNGLPLTFPGTTGVPQPALGGRLMMPT